MRRLTLVGITTEELWYREAEAIEWLLRNGLDRLHVRKPGASIEQIECLVQEIDPALWDRLSLHDGFELATYLPVGGLHLNGRNPSIPSSFSGKRSRSCHSLAEIIEAKESDSDYFFLSPIYSSISKQGYASAFSSKQLQEAFQQGIIDSRTIALGGVTPEQFAEVSSLGFGGVALLGYLWGDQTIYDIKKRYEQCYNSLHTVMPE